MIVVRPPTARLSLKSEAPQVVTTLWLWTNFIPPVYEFNSVWAADVHSRGPPA